MGFFSVAEGLYACIDFYNKAYSSFFPLFLWPLQVQSVVDGYKVSNLSISNLCRQISEALLVKIDGKTVYR